MCFRANRYLFLIFLLGVGSCTSPADQPTTTPPIAATSSAAPATPPATATAGASVSPGQPVSLAGQIFRLKSFPLPADNPDTPPQFRIYLYPSQRPDSVLVAQDTEPSVLDRDQGRRLGVPATAVLLFQTYYAGAGSHYYARVEANQLHIYRKTLLEASPETAHTPHPAWQLVKTFSYFTDGVRQSTR